MATALHEKIVELDDLLPIVAKMRSAGKRVVQCHGCFDVVHPGHVRHLREAAGHGDVLIVSVTADPQVDKGVGRPFIPQELRSENLAALTMVDYVVIDDQSWAGPILEAIAPDVYVKGLEYGTNNDPRFLREKQIVESQGGVVVYSSGEVVYSSTRLQQDQLDADDFALCRLRSLLDRWGITRERLLDRIEQFSEVRIAIAGDAIVDHYIECELIGVANEAPVLQVSPIDEKFYLGGACVLALHAARLGAAVSYIGFLNSQPFGGNTIAGLLEASGIQVHAIPMDGRLIKTRYLVDGQKTFKVDRCKPFAINSAGETAWLSAVNRTLAAGATGLAAVDFGYGTLNRPRMLKTAQLARRHGARLFGDTSSGRYSSLTKFAGVNCDTIFPNESEARAFLGEPEIGLPVLASALIEQGLAENVALTLGARGVVLFERDSTSQAADGAVRYLPEYVPSLARFAVDPLGAGDALTTVSALARLAGAGFFEAILLGSIAAAIVVQRLGNAPVELENFHWFLRHHSLFA